MESNKSEQIEVHLKRKILWWNGEKLQNIRKICAGLKTIHLEIYDDQAYVIVPFSIPDKYGCDSKEGMAFPIKESVEFVATIKARQALLPRDEKKELLDTFIEEYNDFCRSEDKLHWIPKKLRELMGSKKGSDK